MKRLIAARKQGRCYASGPRQEAFTIVELMVSTTLLIGIMVILVSTVDQTQRVWRRSTDKAIQFQGARAAFDSMTRRLSQATLNTYWRSFENDPDAEQSDIRYRRQSELQFLSGPAERIFGAPEALSELSSPREAAYPTHAVFFQAPLGYSEETIKGSSNNERRFGSLGTLLNGCGYFIEYGPEPDRPEFLNDVPSISDRYRFRLMEMTVPAERLGIFKRPADSKGFNDPRIFDEQNQFPYKPLVQKNLSPESGWVRPLWMKDALLREPIAGRTEGSRFRFARPRAENIVALIIIPKLPERDRKTVDEPELAPHYQFDSWRIILRGESRVRDGAGFVTVDNVARDNLLPPIVQVTMVAVDETSMARLNLQKDRPPEWTDGLFRTVKKESEYYDDLQELERDQLAKAGINYRIFSTDVVLRSSKWSRDTVNEGAQ